MSSDGKLIDISCDDAKLASGAVCGAAAGAGAYAGGGGPIAIGAAVVVGTAACQLESHLVCDDEVEKDNSSEERDK